MEVDVELALLDAKKEFRQDLLGRLDKAYGLETRKKTGYGAIIVKKKKDVSSDASECVINFVRPLLIFVDELRISSPIIRIALFHRSAAPTIRFSPLCNNILALLNCITEISVYPTDDED